MTSPLWQKNNPADIDTNIMDYMAGEDLILDKELILYDIKASKAHVKGLASIKILSHEEAEKLITELECLAQEYQQGKFQLVDPSRSNQFEDCHSAIEFYLVEKLGDLGKKVHTGRSRNDQILVATRLYLRAVVEQAIDTTKQSALACLQQAENTQDIAMPGYTHMQRAVPSSAGMWFASFAEAMIDNLISLKSVDELIDCNPLGTAAGYGVNLPLDRNLTTEVLNFSRLQINPIYAQNSRGKFELSVLNALAQCLLDIRRYCWDLSLFTTQEFDFIKLPNNMTTGSSIMPNKRNPDLVELMRASYSTVQASIVELQTILSLPSGYQRDLQLTKAALLRGVKAALATMQLFPQLVESTQFNAEKALQAIDTPMYATDLAVELSASGVPFRQAYQQVVNQYAELESRTPAESLNQRQSAGACANLQLDELNKRLSDFVS